MKTQAKVHAAEQRRVHHQRKAFAKAKRHEARDDQTRRLREEIEKRRAERLTHRVETAHRKRDELADREERRRVKEVQKARRRSLLGSGSGGAGGAGSTGVGKKGILMWVAGRVVDRRKEPRRKNVKGDSGPQIGRQRRERRGHEDAIRRARERKEITEREEREDREHSEKKEERKRSAGLHGGVSWGYDPNVPEEGLEFGSAGRGGVFEREGFKGVVGR